MKKEMLFGKPGLSLYLVEDPDMDFCSSFCTNVLVVAHTAKEAKRLGYNCLDNAEFLKIKVRRIFKGIKTYDKPTVLSWDDPEDLKVYRAHGHFFEGDSCCASCGLYTMNRQFPLCFECEFCAECGHDKGCKENQNR